jgi:hypothetical protein
MLRQLLATLLQAIAPQPGLEVLRRRWSAIRRNVHEPPRKKRHYQNMAMVF